jgi:hypothetical protein
MLFQSINFERQLNKALWEMAEVLRNGGAQKIHPTGERIKPSPETFGAKIVRTDR